MGLYTHIKLCSKLSSTPYLPFPPRIITNEKKYKFRVVDDTTDILTLRKCFPKYFFYIFNGFDHGKWRSRAKKRERREKGIVYWEDISGKGSSNKQLEIMYVSIATRTSYEDVIFLVRSTIQGFSSVLRW